MTQLHDASEPFRQRGPHHVSQRHNDHDRQPRRNGEVQSQQVDCASNTEQDKKQNDPLDEQRIGTVVFSFVLLRWEGCSVRHPRTSEVDVAKARFKGLKSRVGAGFEIGQAHVR